MKKLFLLMGIFLILPSCNASDVEGYNAIENNSDLLPTEKASLPPVQINDIYNDHEFSLEEFPDVTLRIGPAVLNDEGTLTVHPLYVNDIRVTEQTIDRLLFAYDINNDGYRDLIFSENVHETQGNTTHINGFDIHNMKKMENKLGFRQYKMGLEIEDGRLRTYAYQASTISSVTFDYAELVYTDEKGLYFVWDNMYQFKDFKFDSVTLDDENKTVINPVVDENGIHYSLKADVDYIFGIGAPREDNPTIKEFEFKRHSGFDVDVNDDIFPVRKFEFVSSENDIYKYRVNLIDRVKEFEYKFHIPCMSFTINISIVD